MDFAKLQDEIWRSSSAAELLSEKTVAETLVQVQSALALALADVDLCEFDAAAAVCEKLAASAEKLAALGFPPASVQPARGILEQLVAAAHASAAEASPEVAELLRVAAGHQDIADSTLMALSKTALIEVHQQLIGVVLSIMQYVHAFRKSPVLQRNTNGEVGASTFGLQLAGWLDGVVQATAQLTNVIDSLPAQLGGRFGNLSEVASITKNSGEAVQVANAFADRLELQPCAPWHSNRAPLLAISAVAGALASAFSNIAQDVMAMADASVGELGELALDDEGNVVADAGDPNLRERLAMASAMLLTTSQVVATLSAAPKSVDTSRGEWLATLDTLRLTVATAGLGNSLFAALDVHPETMELNLIAAGLQATDLSAAEQIIDAILAGINA